MPLLFGYARQRRALLLPFETRFERLHFREILEIHHSHDFYQPGIGLNFAKLIKLMDQNSRSGCLENYTKLGLSYGKRGENTNGSTNSTIQSCPNVRNAKTTFENRFFSSETDVFTIAILRSKQIVKTDTVLSRTFRNQRNVQLKRIRVQEKNCITCLRLGGNLGLVQVQGWSSFETILFRILHLDM